MSSFGGKVKEFIRRGKTTTASARRERVEREREAREREERLREEMMQRGDSSNARQFEQDGDSETEDEGEQSDSMETSPPNTNENQMTYVPEREEENEDEEEADAGFPGGPVVKDLLLSYENHVAGMIWQGRDVRNFKCINYVAKLKQWELDFENMTAPVTEILGNSNLLLVVNGVHDHLDKTLIRAFSDRWHLESNSFHLPFGEMTITLDDVFCLTGLPVTGQPLLENPSYSKMGPVDIIHQVLGVNKKQANEGLLKRGSGKVSLDWLKKKFSPEMSSPDPRKAASAAKAYLFYVLGCTIFADKTGTCVNVRYLNFFRDEEMIGKYAWGAGALAYLYRQLGKASRYNCNQISGYLTLLQSWVYERFPDFRCDLSSTYLRTSPLTARWDPRGQSGAYASVEMKRQHMDVLTNTDVVWRPYEGNRERYPFPKVSLYIGSIVAANVIEPHLPDRVLRQFGYVQIIPSMPLFHGLPRGDTKTYAGWFANAQLFSRWKNALLDLDDIEEIRVPQDTVNNYLPWYYNVSHPILIPESQRSQAVKRTNEVSQANPWNMLKNVRECMLPIAMRWRSGDESVTAQEFADVIFRALEATELPSTSRGGGRDGPSTSRGGGRD